MHNKRGIIPALVACGILSLAASSAALAQPRATASAPAAPGRRRPPAGDKAPYKPADGPLGVGVVVRFELPRRDGGAPLPLLVRYPSEPPSPPAPLPLVVFSHGGGGDGDAFAALSRHWASWGYVVIHPTHRDSVRWRRSRGEDLRALRRHPRLLLRSIHLADRRADIELILDSLDRVEAEIRRAAGRAAPPEATPPPLRIDRRRIALAGHSAGAMTAQALAGVRLHVGRRIITLRDDRIRAVILISGQGVWRRSLRPDSWRDIHIPMLMITGSRDTAPITDETPETRRQPFTYAPPGDKFLLFIDGATHFSYTHRMRDPWASQPPPNNPDYITSVVSFSTLAFLDAYLRDDPAARRYLRSRAITHYRGGKVRFEMK